MAPPVDRQGVSWSLCGAGPGLRARDGCGPAADPELGAGVPSVPGTGRTTPTVDHSAELWLWEAGPAAVPHASVPGSAQRGRRPLLPQTQNGDPASILTELVALGHRSSTGRFSLGKRFHPPEAGAAANRVPGRHGEDSRLLPTHPLASHWPAVDTAPWSPFETPQ